VVKIHGQIADRLDLHVYQRMFREQFQHVIENGSPVLMLYVPFPSRLISMAMSVSFVFRLSLAVRFFIAPLPFVNTHQ